MLVSISLSAGPSQCLEFPSQSMVSILCLLVKKSADGEQLLAPGTPPLHHSVLYHISVLTSLQFKLLLSVRRCFSIACTGRLGALHSFCIGPCHPFSSLSYRGQISDLGGEGSEHLSIWSLA